MFQSTWGSQQNQQQPTTSAFGQPSAFGTANAGGGAFGSTGTFGQPQQPQVNPMFGNISTTPSTNTGTSGFGAFGGNPGTSSVFSAPKPASGFGAFSGGAGAFGGGSTSAFGQPTAGASSNTSVFGQPTTTTTTPNAFGGGTGLFGGGNKSAFGTLGGNGAAPPVVTTGTANPLFSVTTEKEGSVTQQFQSITSMPAYQGCSFEELRVQDYAQNRKAAAQPSAFGATSAFGTAQPATTNIFGQSAQQPSTLFSGTTNANTAPTSGFNTFGQPSSTNPTSTFGGNTFGQTQPQQQQGAFGTTGGFGQGQQPQQQQSSVFGGASTSAFGNTGNKPAFGTFGGGTTGGFGAGTTSGFGGTQQNQQPAQGTGLFGSTQPATNTPAFNAFGNNTAKPSIFGTSTTNQPSTMNPFGGGAFGATQQPQPQQQGTSLFGGGTGTLFGNQSQPTTTSLFGNPQQNTTTPSLFGNNSTTTGTGLFGNTQQNQQAQQNSQQPANPFGNLFGQKPAQTTGASLFGGGAQTSQPQQQTSMFGNNFGQSMQGNSLFNSKPATSAIGTSLSGSTNMGTTLFNSSTANPGAQGTLTASIAQPIGENLPIFDLLPPGPRIIDLDQNLPKKRVGFFLDMPTRSPVPRVTLGYTPANSKLRGFGSSTSLGPLNASNSGISLTTGRVSVLALSKSDMRASSVGPDFGRSGSPALGSGGRQSVKKVILDKKVDPSELFVKSGSPGGLKSSKVTFSPQLSIASREKDAQLASALSQVPSAASRNQQRSSGLFGTKGPTKETVVAAGTEPEEKGEAELDEGDYWVKPELSTLKKAGHDELSSFSNLVVGRKGYGEIQFLEPVDLTGLPKLGALLGNVVRFDDKECSVYPDSDDVDKPPPGSGLNVKARLILERCWANDKATREPIKDPNHLLAMKHLKRLKNMKDTHFESFDMKTGTWTFVVDHF